MLTRHRPQLIFFPTAFSVWTRCCVLPQWHGAIRLFISRDPSARQAFSIIAFLVLNLICSLTQSLLHRLIMPSYISLSLSFLFFWLHHHLERTLHVIYPETGWHNAIQSSLSSSLSVFLFGILKRSAKS